MIPAPNQSNVYQALAAFLAAALPGVVSVQGQPNRTPEPAAQDFIVMTAMRRDRLSTNVDTYADALFAGSISGEVMTVTDMDFGLVRPGATVFGVGVAPGTMVTMFETGDGGAGTYAVSPAQTVAAGALSAGAQTITQNVDVVVQLDVHGPNSADNAQVISTLMRDPYGVQLFADQVPQFGVTPLYADDPRQSPFVNAENQYENRWIVEAHLQVDQAVTVPQQFSDVISVVPISVEAPPYPP